MANSKNKYSVKGEIFKKATSRKVTAFDGPWKPTIEEAVEAYAAKHAKAGLNYPLVFHVFMAEQVSEAEAPAQDSRGVYYRRAATDKSVKAMLEAVGVPVSSET